MLRARLKKPWRNTQKDEEWLEAEFDPDFVFQFIRYNLDGNWVSLHKRYFDIKLED